MTTHRTCARCGAKVPEGVDACPACRMALGLEDRAAAEHKPVEPSGTPAPPPRPDPTIEELRALFPDLEIEERIGRGGMGLVYRARQKRLARVVALKVLAPELSARPGFRERFLREARTLAVLAHPNIVAVHDFGETQGLCWILMEFVDGVDLRRALRSGGLAPRQALTIVRELCDALQFAHDEGIVHRDIKPENVLLDRRGRVKVADFGLAKIASGPEGTSHLTAMDQVMGTPHYMAPEQMERPLEVDHRADIYALGVVLYEMLTGSLPRGNFEPPSHRVHVDVKLDEIVLRALERAPERRYQHAVDVKTDVDLLRDPSSASPGAPVDPLLGSGIDSVLELGGEGRSATAPQSVVRAAPGSFVPWWGSFAAFALLWMTTGMVAHSAFVLGIVGAVFAFCWTAIVKSTAEKDSETRARLANLSSGASARKLLGAGALAFAAYFVVLLAHYAWWERGTAQYEPPAHGAEALERSIRDGAGSLVHPFELLAPAPDGDVPFHVERRSVVTGWDGLLAGSPLAYAAIALGLLLASGAPLLGRRFGAAGWVADLGPAAHTATAALLPFVLIDLAPIAVDTVLRRSRIPLSRSSELEAPLDRAASAVYQQLVDRGYEVQAEVAGTLSQPGMPGGVVRVHALSAAMESPLDRWQPSWSGPKRRTPQLRVLLFRDESGSHTRMDVEAGSLRNGERVRRLWETTVLESLEVGVRAELARGD